MRARGLLRRAHRVAHRRKARIRNASWIGAVVTVALVVASVASGASGSSRCVPDPPPDHLPQHPGKQAVLTTEAEGFRLHFADARDVKADVVIFADDRVTLAPGDKISASMSPYLRNSDRTLWPGRDDFSDRVSPSAQVLRITPAGQVEVCLELDADLVDGEYPGQYTTAERSSMDGSTRSPRPCARSTALSMDSSAGSIWRGRSTPIQ